MKRAGTAAGVWSLLMGGGHLIAWVTGFMARVPASTIVMKTNAGLGLVACGLALILSVPDNPSPRRRRIALICAGFALAIGALTLSEHLVGWNLGIDELIANELPGAAATASPNRMGPPASLSFVLVGTALLLLPSSVTTRRWRHQPFALLALLLGLPSIVGYLYGASGLYQVARLTGVAWPTSLSMIVLAIGILCARPAVGVMARLTADDPGGTLVRALLGPILLLPIALGWLRLAAERRGWVDAAMGTGLMMLVFIVTFSSLLLFASRQVSKASAAVRASERDIRRQKDLLAGTLAERQELLSRVQAEKDRLFALVNSMSDEVWFCDTQKRFTLANPAAAQAFALTSADDVEVEPLAARLDVRRPDGSPRPIEEAPPLRALNGEMIVEEEEIIRTPGTGELRHREISAAPVRNAAGAVIGSVSVVRDITARRQMELERDRLAQQHQLALDAARMGWWHYDPVTRIVTFDRRYTEIFGVSGHQRPDDEIVRLLHPDDLPRVWAAVEAALDPADPRPYSTEHRVRRPDGAVRWVEAHGVALFEGEGAARHAVDFVGTVADITERKDAELALQQSADALREADHRKNEFLAVLSHELRNPLAAVRSAVDVLDRADPGSTPATRAREVIARQAAQLARLVDDLLDVARITRGKIHLQREAVDLTGLVRRTVDDHRTLFAGRGIRLDAVLPDRALWVTGDAHRLAQIVGNLLHNAAKFTERGGACAVRVREDGHGTGLITVSDTGIGISPDALEHLFEPFMQAHRTIDRRHGGLGLGLTLVKVLVEMHGGAVDARSDGVGQGAEFAIRLPLEAGPPAAPGPPSARPARARRVLIIEDNEDAAGSLRDSLELASHRVEVAYTGPDGIDMARRFRPEVVLCDIGLPGTNGYDVARALRADATLGPMYLIALTGYALPADLARARDAGFDAHVAKPPNPEKLKDLIAAVDPTHGADPQS